MKKLRIMLLAFVLTSTSCLIINPSSSKAYWDRDYPLWTVIDGIEYTTDSSYAEDEIIPVDKDVYYVTGFEQSYDEQGKPLYTDIVILDEIYGIPVVGIDTYAFNNHKEITSVKLSKNLRTGNAFNGCTGITELILPDGIECVGGYDGCFNLTELILPDSVKIVGGFNGCTGLTEVILPEGIEDVNGFDRCTGLTEVILPDSVKRVTGFDGCTGLTEVILPEGVKVVGGFSGCINLKRITFPKSVEKIYSNAFNGCSSLNEIVFKNSNPEYIQIENSVFRNTLLANEAKAKGEPLILKGGFLIDGSGVVGDVELDGNEVRAIASNAFRGNKKISEVKIKGVSYIGAHAFQRSSITKLKIVDVGYVSELAFKFSSLKKATVKEVAKFEESVFEDCRELKECKISGVKAIPESTFFRCKKLKKVTLGKETKYIGAGCFYNCQSLKRIIINSKKKIVWKTTKPWYAKSEGATFGKCNKLKKITLKSKKISSTIKKVKFPKGVKLDVPNGAKAKYRKYVDCKVI